MKVGIWLPENYKPAAGGGFSYLDMFISSVDNHIFNGLTICFVSPEKINIHKKQVFIIPKIYYLGYKASRKILRSLPVRMSTSMYYLFEKRINAFFCKNDIKIIFYPFQGDAIFTNFPFISNNWDIGHRSTFAFPELSYQPSFEEREQWYRRFIHKALLVFCESEAGKKEFIKYSGIADEKVKVMPIFAGKSIEQLIPDNDVAECLKKFNLEKREFYFYPAQFWAHKNHYGLLKAMSIIVKNFPRLKLIFTGSDKGNLEYIKKLVIELNLQDNIVFAGFVSYNEIAIFYKNASALVMPTFFGPTNMPLIEALALQCPVVCTDLEGHREMLSDAALYFKADNHAEIAHQMEQVLSTQVRNLLLENGKKVFQKSKFKIEEAVKSFEHHLLELKNIRCCWD